MLQELNRKMPRQRKVAIQLADTALAEMLSGLLAEWGYRTADMSDKDALLLSDAEEGTSLTGRDRLCLGRGDLSFPLRLEQLWLKLEQLFHDPPRAHIRYDVNLPAEVVVRGESASSKLCSLSDMGGRFSFSRELVRGEKVSLRFELNEQSIEAFGKVIYAIHQSARDDDQLRVGMLFNVISGGDRAFIRNYLIYCYLEDVRAGMAEASFNRALASLELPEWLLARLVPC